MLLALLSHFHFHPKKGMSIDLSKKLVLWPDSYFNEVKSIAKVPLVDSYGPGYNEFKTPLIYRVTLEDGKYFWWSSNTLKKYEEWSRCICSINTR